jgi:hypothetical protein
MWIICYNLKQVGGEADGSDHPCVILAAGYHFSEASARRWVARQLEADPDAFKQTGEPIPVELRTAA